MNTSNADGRHHSLSPESESAALDDEQLSHAIGRIKDPVLRYLLAQLVDLCTARIEQLEAALEDVKRRRPLA